MVTEREYQASRRSRGAKRHTNLPKSTLLWTILILGILGLVSHYSDSNTLNLSLNIINPDLRIIPANLVPGVQNVVKIDFTKIDAEAKGIKYNGSSVSELAKLLSAKATTDVDKARIIYTWIALNIDYDVIAFNTGKYGDLSPKGVLKTRRAVCSGYANLYQSLAAEMGLESFVISGYAKGLSYLIGENQQENHAWNGVKINDGWYLVDATWGAGTVDNNQFNRKFNGFYFATPPEQLIYTHLPTNPNWQLLKTKYTKDQFISLPRVSPQFFTTQLKLLFAGYNSEGKYQILLQAPENVVITAQLTSQEEKLTKEKIKIQRRNGQIFIDVDVSNNADYLHIYAKFNHQQGSYPHAVSWKIAQ